jgi:hypothetical protein
MPSSHSNRSPRFERTDVRPIRITKRDVQIIGHVFEHRFLHSRQIIDLLGKGHSRQHLLRRLRLLFHHRYLDRPPAQIQYYRRGGSRPMVYALGDRGADVLSEKRGVLRGKIRWQKKNRSVGRVFMEHTLKVADFMVELVCACRKHPTLSLIPQPALLQDIPEPTRKRATRGESPFYWRVQLGEEEAAEDVGVVPDQIFALEKTDRPAGRNRSYFFLEVDRATMSVLTKNLSKSSIYKKLRGYLATWKAGVHEERFGFSNMRTLFATTSGERVENFAHAAEHAFADQRAPSRRGKVFLFASQPELSRENLLTYEWQNPIDDSGVAIGQ